MFTTMNMNGRRQKTSQKDTRWDRIRKRHLSSVQIKTDAVRKFVGMDFIGKNCMRIMNGESEKKLQLDPVLVMDLRHKIFQKSSQKLATPPVIARQQSSCVEHNLQVEEHYILNELNKFRDHLDRSRKRYELKPQKEIQLRVSNDEILESLEIASKCMKNFYKIPIEAMEKVNEFEGMKAPTNEKTFGNVLSIVGSSESLNEKVPTKNENDAKSDNCLTEEDSCHSPGCRTESTASPIEETGKFVRFQPAVTVVSYNREMTPIEKKEIDLTIEEAKGEIRESERGASDNGDDKIGKVQLVEQDEPLLITKLDVPSAERKMEEIKIDPIQVQPSSTTQASNEIISQLFQSHPTHNNNIGLLRKYFIKWIHYTTFEKIEKQSYANKNDRILKINSFLDNLRKEKRMLARKSKCDHEERPSVEMKPSLPAQVTKKYRNKIKIQQDIIDLQRVKLERQERLIMRLKLNKLTDEMRETREEVKNELKAAMRSGDANFRAKARCIQMIGDFRDDEDDDDDRLQGTALMTPKFLANMQERALERSVKHEQAKQRRMQIEADREAQKLAMEEARRLEDEEAKRVRIEQLKEKRRLEKMAKIIKERERQKAIANNKKAHDFYCRHLLKRIGMEGFRRLLERKHENQRKSEQFRLHLVKKSAFTVWKEHYEACRDERNRLADNLHERFVQRKALVAWIMYARTARSKYFVAVDWYDLKLAEKTFNHWHGHTVLQKAIEETKMQQAASHHEWHLKWKVIDRWQRLPHILKLERETEERRQRWRIKIWELLPDYTPNRESNF